jgi:hypothetical protein
MRICYDNFVDYAATLITATTESLDLPVTNVADPDRQKVYRTGTSVAGEAVMFDLGSAKAVQAVVLLDHTLTSGDSSIALQGGAAPGATTVDEEIIFAAGTMVLFLPAPTAAYQYWQIVFTKASAGVSRDIGRIFLGLFEEMARGPQLPDGLTITPTDLSVTDRALSGKTYSDIKGQYDAISIDFPPVSDAQMEIIKTIAAAVGTHTPFFVSIDPTLEPTDLFYYVKAKSFKGRKVKMWGSGAAAWDLGMELNEEI